MRPVERNIPQEPSVIARVSLIVRAFRHDDGVLGVSELARRTGLAKSTVHRIVRDMVAYGWMERSGSGVRLGLGLFELGQRVPHQRTLREVAIPFMADLRESTRQTVHLAILDGRDVLYLEILHARGAPRLLSRVGCRVPAHATGLGKAILAHSRPELIRSVLGGPLERVSPRTITSPHLLGKSLEAIRTTGVGYDREESGVGIVCAASPIFGPDGVVGSISVSGRSGRTNLQQIAAAVQVSAQAISRSLRHDAGSAV
jgi:IclR family transcriptional regulator, acetate operon repressor